MQAATRSKKDDSSSETRTDEVQEAIAEAIGSLKGITHDTATLITIAIYDGGINEPRFLRDIDADDTMAVLQDFEALKTKRFLAKTMASAIREQFRTGSPKRSPAKSTATSEHTATSSAVAISAVKPTARLATNESDTRPGLAKTEEFLDSTFQPYGPYDLELITRLQEVKQDTTMTREQAAQHAEDTDPLVSMALAKFLTNNMGTQTYHKYVRSQLDKSERECPIMIAWQLLAEARKVSELDLAKRYVKLLQPTKPRTPQQLTAAYQTQVDEEEELIMQGFACKCRSRDTHFKKSLLDMCDNHRSVQRNTRIILQRFSGVR